MTLAHYLLAAVAGGLGPYFAVGGVLELAYYRARRDRAAAWKCQPRRFPPARTRLVEIALGGGNLVLVSIASGAFAWWVAGGGRTALYFDLARHGLAFTLATALAYFLVTDCGLYWAHRLLHRRAAFRLIHRWHHRFTSPTAFAATAMHPLELALYQAVMAAPLFVVPLHVVAVVVVLAYQQWVALVDHSGVRLRSLWPWQPPTRFHDDHHLLFHVNFGQSLGVWDRLFGTWRRQGRVYGAAIFGGHGAPIAADSDGKPRWVRYGKHADPAISVEESAPARQVSR